MPKIAIRPVALADSSDILQGIGEGELCDAVPGSEAVRTEADAAAMVSNLVGKGAAGTELHFSICLENSKVVGMCALHDFDHKRHSAKIGYWISRPYRKKGFGKEAVGLLIKVAFEELGIRKLYAVAGQDNVASVHFLRSLNFADAGTSRDVTMGGKLLFSLQKTA